MNSKLNPASETISMVKAAQTNEEDIPVAPLPNPGEGGPVYDDSMDNFLSVLSEEISYEVDAR